MADRFGSLMMAALAMKGLLVTPAVTAAPREITHLASVTPNATSYIPSGASRLSSSLGRPVAEQRRYSITCYDNGAGVPRALLVRIRGLTKSRSYALSLSIEREGVRQSVVDNFSGDGLFSPYAILEQGAGTYTVTIEKQKKKNSLPDSSLLGPVVFETQQECDAANAHYTGIQKPVPIP